MDIDLRVTQLIPPLTRYRSEEWPPIVFEGKRRGHHSNDSLFDFRGCDNDSRRFSLPEVTSSLPEVTSASTPEITYGMRPRMAWLYRYRKLFKFYILPAFVLGFYFRLKYEESLYR